MSLTTDGSLYFEILDDGTTRSDHSAVIQLAANTCDSHARYLPHADRPGEHPPRLQPHLEGTIRKEDGEMTDHDYWLEDQREKTRKPNYTRRRIIFAIVSIGLISSLTIMLTWHGGSTTAALMVEGVYIATALWLIVRFAPRE